MVGSDLKVSMTSAQVSVNIGSSVFNGIRDSSVSNQGKMTLFSASVCAWPVSLCVCVRARARLGDGENQRERFTDRKYRPSRSQY